MQTGPKMQRPRWPVPFRPPLLSKKFFDRHYPPSLNPPLQFDDISALAEEGFTPEVSCECSHRGGIYTRGEL